MVFLAFGTGNVWMAGALGALLLVGGALVVNGALRRSRAANAGPAGKLGAGQWWLVPAVAGGLVEVVMGTGQLISDPKIENVVALAIVGGAGVLVLAGTWIRTRSRSTGDWMIAAGLLPFLTLFWAIWPSVLAGIVIAMAIADSVRRPQPQEA